MAMGFAMGMNFLLLVAMVATNILSFYHLSSTSTFFRPKPPPPPSLPPVPDHLLRHLHTIRATINHLHTTRATTTTTNTTTTTDLHTFSLLSPIASSCHNHPDLLHNYMNYTPFSLCPKDTQLAESLSLRGCHPLPRRRCFSQTPSNPNPNPKLGFDINLESRKFLYYKSDLDLTIPQLMDIAKRSNSVIRLAIDIGGGAGTFAVRMRDRNVTVVTMTMNLGAPYSESNALRGVVPIHAPLQQRLPVFDGTMDLVRCGHAVNRWIPLMVMEFLFFDVDRVLRGGGFLWVDHFFSKGVDLEKVYKPLINKLEYKIVKWVTGNKMDSKGVKNEEVYLTALLQKPKSR